MTNLLVQLTRVHNTGAELSERLATPPLGEAATHLVLQYSMRNAERSGR